MLPGRPIIFTPLVITLENLIYLAGMFDARHRMDFEDIYGFSSPFDDHLLDPNKNQTDHIELADSKGSSSLRGKFFMSEAGWRTPLIEANEKQVMSSTVLATGGIDFDTTAHIGGLRKALYTLIKGTDLPYINIGDEKKSTGDFRPVFYIPPLTKKARYKEIMSYSNDKTYTSKYTNDFAEKYIWPRLYEGIMEQNLSRFSLFNFSAACRENLMIENSIAKIFKSFGIPQNQSLAFMQQIHALNIGHAIDWGNPSVTRFSRTTFLSGNDYGVLKPFYATMLPYLVKEESEHKIYEEFVLPEHYGTERLYLLAPGTVPHILDSKVNYTGHALPHYASAIVNNLPMQDKRALISPMVDWDAMLDAIDKCGGLDNWLNFSNEVAK